MSDSTSRAERVAAYVQRISRGPDFPALSGRIRDVVQILSDEDMTIQHLANTILRDYSLTMKVLRTANSFHYNRAGTPILSVTQAMVVLGVSNVRDLARSLIVFEHYQGRSPGLKELMLLSMLTASHARETAERVGYQGTEQAHLRGMFRNIGEVLVACHAPADYAAIMARLLESRERVTEACSHVLGFPYEALGHAVSRLWGIAPAGAATTPPSEELDSIVEFSHELTTAVYRREAGDSPATLSAVMQKHGAVLGLAPDTLRAILERGIFETKEVFDSLSISLNDLKLRHQCEAALADLAPGTTPGLPESPGPEAPDGEAARESLLAMIETTMAASEEFDLNHTLLTILEAVLRAGPFDRAIFCVVNAERTEAIGRFGLGDDVEARLPRIRFALSMAPQAAPAGRALLQGVDLVVPSSPDPDHDETRFLQQLDVRSAALFPVTAEGRLVGALYAARMTMEAPPDASTLAFLGRARHLTKAALMLVRARTEARRAAAIPPAQRYEGVLRVLRGESVEAVSRDVGVSATDIERWRDAFLSGAMSALKDA